MEEKTQPAPIKKKKFAGLIVSLVILIILVLAALQMKKYTTQVEMDRQQAAVDFLQKNAVDISAEEQIEAVNFINENPTAEVTSEEDAEIINMLNG